MFTHHTFTDECSVQLSANSRYVFCLRGDVQRRVRSVHKNPVKVMIWGGISWDGATQLFMMGPNTKINSSVYQGIIESAYPSIHNRSLYGEHPILIQDNAPVHSALQTKEYFARSGIKNLAQLKEGIAKRWKEVLTVDECRKYIIRVQKQMRKVIEQQGGPVYD
ncbi:hypothetical protein PRIPAC_86821 [Pristionchus pacificus]|uniref:Uncharacterized protein n=1 Tax=Pristionchus pacificus TaxID=54126 RepID=A0A2A6BV54_PRIPA|nr:hypothetical protein PRIPAC_86821 [Pristionchus pacificus]|eukprot:PDM69673.1 hypothetical protein PRIPAC_44769 [Pristionchus pacificus]